MDFILVLAEITPKEGCHDTIVELAEELVYESRLEDENIDYRMLSSVEDDTLTFVEKWQSEKSLEKHMASPHFLNFSEESDEFVEKTEIQIIKADEISL